MSRLRRSPSVSHFAALAFVLSSAAGGAWAAGPSAPAGPISATAPGVATSADAAVSITDMTWEEIRDAVHAGRTTVIIPIGGTEQSGPFIAVGKHDVRAYVLSHRIARELGNALVAPVISYVPEGSYAPPTSHMRFPGTITIPDDVFEKMLVSAANSFKVHGFTRVIFLGDHGGYTADLRRVAAQLNRSWASGPARAYVPETYYRTSSSGFNDILRSRGFRDDEIGTHAGLADAALQMAVAPSMVRSAEMRDAPKPGLADGVYGGDPRRATAALGALGIDAIVKNTVAEIRDEQKAQ